MWLPGQTSRSRRKLPMIFQTEAAECGLACLAMVAHYHGYRTDLPTLRRRMEVSLRGSNLEQIIHLSAQLEMGSRPLRVELETLPFLTTPCILHWDMSHFVVLKRATRKHLFIHDPALGPRRLTYTQASPHFTGVALELAPLASFAPTGNSRSLRLRDLVGRIAGLKRSLAQIFLLAALLEVFVLLSPLFLQFAVDRVIAGRHAALLTELGIGFALLVVLQALVGLLRSWATLYFGTSVKLQWNANIFSHLVRLPVSFFEKRYFGDVLSRFQGAEQIQHTLTNNFAEAVLDGLISIFLLGVLVFYSAELALIVAAAAFAYAALRHFTYQPLRGASEQQIVQLAKQHSFFIETLRGIRTIKVFGGEDRRQARWMNLLVDTTNAQVATEKFAILFKSANALLFGLLAVAIVWLGVTLVLAGTFTVGMLFAFVAYQEQFKARVATLVDRVFDFRMLSLQAQRLADVVLEKPQPFACSLPSVAGLEGSIELRSLFFRYSSEDAWLLRDVSLRIAPGECVGLTGPSGVGKSTLLKLIAGLLEPQAGEVSIGGRSMTADRAAAIGKVGFVLQDDSLFSGTLAENIAFGTDAVDMQRVEECARIASLHDDIAAMPMGYNTLIGDMGSALSGGQQQRLLLARALYPRPSILLLDEATSHLDLETERRVTAALAQLRVTRVFAAHRPETLTAADRILSLDRSGATQPVAAVGAATLAASVSSNFGSHGPENQERG